MSMESKGHGAAAYEGIRPVCADFSPTGDRIAVGFEDGTEKIWNMATGVCELDIHEHDSSLQGIKFSSSGDQIASSTGNIIRVWSANNGSP